MFSTLTQQLNAVQETHDQQKRLHASNAQQISKLQDKESQLLVSLEAANEAITELKDEKKKLLMVMGNIKKFSKG